MQMTSFTVTLYDDREILHQILSAEKKHKS